MVHAVGSMESLDAAPSGSRSAPWAARRRPAAGVPSRHGGVADVRAAGRRRRAGSPMRAPLGRAEGAERAAQQRQHVGERAPVPGRSARCRSGRAAASSCTQQQRRRAAQEALDPGGRVGRRRCRATARGACRRGRVLGRRAARVEQQPGRAAGQQAVHGVALGEPAERGRPALAQPARVVVGERGRARRGPRRARCALGGAASSSRARAGRRQADADAHERARRDRRSSRRGLVPRTSP